MAIHAAPERVVLNVIDLLAVVFGQAGRQRGLELLEGAPQPAGSPVELASGAAGLFFDGPADAPQMPPEGV